MTSHTQRLVVVALAAAVVAGAASAYGGVFPQAHGEASGHGDGAAHVEHAEGAQAEAEKERGSRMGKVAGAVLISVAGVALIPVSILVRRRKPSRDAAASTTARRSPGATESLLAPVAMLSAGAGVIHFAVIAPHLEEWWLTGVFFLLLAPLQLGWAILVLLVEPSRTLLVAAAGGNLIVAAVWVVTRTTGLPVGPDAGEVEAFGFADVAATAYEVLLAVGSLALLRFFNVNPFRWLARPIAYQAVSIIVIAITSLSLVSLVKL